jgi:hypothetical protein
VTCFCCVLGCFLLVVCATLVLAAGVQIQQRPPQTAKQGNNYQSSTHEWLTGRMAHRIACRGLLCKVEEVHRTLRKHLHKEEEQLVPLLLAHFSHGEQAALVAQVGRAGGRLR